VEAYDTGCSLAKPARRADSGTCISNGTAMESRQRQCTPLGPYNVLSNENVSFSLAYRGCQSSSVASLQTIRISGIPGRTLGYMQTSCGMTVMKRQIVQ
jgi:hypothetical protein